MEEHHCRNRNANFKTAITSDSDLDSLLGNCFFGGIGYTSLYFDIADFNGIQIDNGSQRTQIVVALNDLLYRTDDVEDGHTGSWSEWHTLPYNTTTLLSTLSSEKLDKSQVANNVATTKSGYALDARQGKELNDAIADKQKTLKLAHWNGNITTYANNGRTVTISPATLGISGAVTIYSVNVYANAETYNNIFLSHSGYTAGTGVKIYAYNATSTGKEFPVTVDVLYSQA